MFVELENTVEGLIRFDKMGDEYFIYDEDRKRLIGERTNNIISNICSVGNNTILKISLKCEVNSIINISKADTICASMSFELLNGFDLNIDLWLFLILNMCTSSDNAST